MDPSLGYGLIIVHLGADTDAELIETGFRGPEAERAPSADGRPLLSIEIGLSQYRWGEDTRWPNRPI